MAEGKPLLRSMVALTTSQTTSAMRATQNSIMKPPHNHPHPAPYM